MIAFVKFQPHFTLNKKEKKAESFKDTLQILSAFSLPLRGVIAPLENLHQQVFFT